MESARQWLSVFSENALVKEHHCRPWPSGCAKRKSWMSEQLVCFDNWRPSSPDKARTIACQFRANEPAAFCIVLRIGSASGRFPAHEIFDSQGKTGAAGKD